MQGEKITVSNGVLNVPNNPIVPYIEGDGIGPDIWASASRVLDAAVEKAYNGERKIEWKEVLAGEKAFNQTGEWLPQETLDVISEYLLAIKGPLTTPVGGGIRYLTFLHPYIYSGVCNSCLLRSRDRAFLKKSGGRRTPIQTPMRTNSPPITMARVTVSFASQDAKRTVTRGMTTS